MKMNKKIIIPFFSTVVGLSMAAGIGGAFAWYQYNSQATMSFVGTSVADTGILQIGHYEIEDVGGVDTPVMKWGRDFYGNADLSRMVPVTFGKMGQNNALPEKAYAYPEANCGSGYSNWEEATAGQEYAQFDVYFRALVPDSSSASGYKNSARDVFITNSVIKSLTNNKVADEALRIHLAVEGGSNYLLSKSAHSATAQTALNLYGPLDLDNSGEDDTYYKTAFNNVTDQQVGQTVIYGVDGDKQETVAADSLKVARKADGTMPVSGDEDYSKKLFSTSASANVKVTVTIWLEGWEYLAVDDQETKKQIWNPAYSADTDVQVGLEFDSGVFRGSDLVHQ